MILEEWIRRVRKSLALQLSCRLRADGFDDRLPLPRRLRSIAQTDQLGMDAYRWLNGPWPWELCERGEG